MGTWWPLLTWALALLVGAEGECPPDYASHPTIIVSLDGFRADYVNRGRTPTLETLANRGVKAPYIFPSYPSLTFPNHYTIVTGLYPESHGIIANKFYDPEFYATFDIGEPTQLEPRWWGGEPIWNALTREGKRSATFFWPGSDVEIGGTYPTYWMPYDGSIPFEDRVDQVLDWISLPESERPLWISLYFDEPDHTAHGTGPDDPLVDNELEYMDIILNRLIEGLTAKGLLECVNIIVLADHGMASSVGIQDYVIKLADYIPNVYDLAYVFTGAFSRLDPKDDSDGGKSELMDPLVCQRDSLRAYLREELPTRHHFSNNRRIEDIVLDVNPGYTVSVSYDYTNLGHHGYDNHYKTMNALFVAAGPDFLESVELEPFQNIELYNLMCVLAGVEPAVNNGTMGSLLHALKNPPEPPILPQEERPPTSSFPSGDLTPLLNMSSCEGDLTSSEDWLNNLDMTPEDQASAESRHLPWGIPQSGNLPASLTLLHHLDHVTGYSEAIKMPLWTSLSVESPGPSNSPQPWTSDVRLNPSTAQTCPSYQPLNVSMYPLFPPGLSQNSTLSREPYLVSNAVPVSDQLASRWSQLIDQFVPSWIDLWGPLNLLLGPVFDNDADSYPDNFTTFSTPEVPSDLFAVMTRCVLPVTSIDLCPYSSLDVIAFIFPQTQFKSNCLNATRFANEYSARVHDVEIATGLTLYPDVDFYNRTALTLRTQQDIWPLSFKDSSQLKKCGE